MVNIQETKNKLLIRSMVKKYFNLSKDSFKLFEDRLLFKPHFNDMYKSLGEFDETGRMYIPINEEYYEMFDSGYLGIKNNLKFAVTELGVNYQNYINNSIIIDKQKVKLQKAIYNYIVKESNNRNSHYYGYADTTRDKFDAKQKIKNIFEKAAESSLSKNKKLFIVISLNFADWFLCSTRESWTSCLSLESSYSDLYWSGLPGLIGDKNRAMIYITDKTKKNYKGIITDKFIARSWMLSMRSEKNYANNNNKIKTAIVKNEKIFAVIKSYPLRIDFPKILNTLIDTKFQFVQSNDISGSTSRFNDNEPFIISAYKSEMLFHHLSDDITAYVYQDGYSLNPLEENCDFYREKIEDYYYVNRIIKKNYNKYKEDDRDLFNLHDDRNSHKNLNGLSKMMDINYTLAHAYRYRYRTCSRCSNKIDTMNEEVNILNIGLGNSCYCKECYEIVLNLEAKKIVEKELLAKKEIPTFNYSTANAFVNANWTLSPTYSH